MIYLIIILSFIILSYVYDYRGVTRFRLIWWLSLMVVLICVAGFRYQMGTDSIKYENEFKWLQPTLQDLRAEDFKNTRFAPLYIILSAACKSLTPEFMLVQFVVATIVNCTIFRFIWKNTPHIFLACFIVFSSISCLTWRFSGRRSHHVFSCGHGHSLKKVNGFLIILCHVWPFSSMSRPLSCFYCRCYGCLASAVFLRLAKGLFSLCFLL